MPLTERGRASPDRRATQVRQELRTQSLAKSLHLQRQSFVLDELAHLKSVYNVTIVYPDQVLCPANSCEVALDGLPIYRDEHHLTVKGAKQLEPLFEQAM